jgi:hypothetical protein
MSSSRRSRKALHNREQGSGTQRFERAGSPLRRGQAALAALIVSRISRIPGAVRDAAGRRWQKSASGVAVLN